ncbi:MAG: peroxiredoxin [Woeseiaceae bacterium]|jgi:peroxiredoxin|nr:peroxiredoxin [Woeseiaceae bacterium]
MTISVGENMPSGTFGVMADAGPSSISTNDLFSDKRVVLVSVPGAFTPTCSMSHLPGYIDQISSLTKKNVDTVACMAVNDVFVMDAWGKDSGVGNNIIMLADGNGEYARALGLEMDATSFGMGIRSQRFAIIVDDGVISHLAIEAPGQLDVSKAEAILEAL